MTPEQKQHLASINNWFVALNSEKYAAGAKEHGTNLWEYDLLWYIDQAINEAADQLNYLHDARNKAVALIGEVNHLRKLEAEAVEQ